MQRWQAWVPREATLRPKSLISVLALLLPLGACGSDLAVQLRSVSSGVSLQVEVCERGVALQSSADRACTFVSNVVCGQICAFQRPIDLEHTSQRVCSGSTNLVAL